jgi:putative mycofactocin binding protein MftB
MSVSFQAPSAGGMVPENTTYRLSPGVQVRNEKFGLLFYDYRGPRLYFLPTGDLIDETFFSGCQTVGQLIAAIYQKRQPLRRQEIVDYVNQIFAKLAAKELIHGQSLC